ncbi:type I pullulanase [Halanaerobacter jeridensis]|uniref:pullulanase n=1 Tax=Halanaerobacter jeridensis TaxID=706427 RepID=A0A938XQ70_9FIRM|nr:type I pullulanase [Halanaerobacter jeridensis]MBM7555421.1 pullulanase [Halanaerobacter jeridensis]
MNRDEYHPPQIPEGYMRLHYIQDSSYNYLEWDLYIWGPGYNGKKLKWGFGLEVSGIDEYGVYWDIPGVEGQEINFIVHNDYTRVSNIAADYKFEEGKELWAVKETNQIHNSLEKALEDGNITKIPAPSENYVRLHYCRCDANYDGWQLRFWQEDEETGEEMISGEIKTNDVDTCGAYWDIPCKEEYGKLKFVIFKGEEEEFNGVQEYPYSEGINEIWMKAGDSTQYKNGLKLFERNEIEEAMIFAENKIVLRFKYAVEDRIWVKYGSKVIPIQKIDDSKAPEYYLTLDQNLDYDHPYTVKAGRLTAKTILSPEIIDENYTYHGSLGVDYSPQKSSFKLWAPSAQRVELELFAEQNQVEPNAVYPLRKDENGVWYIEIEEDLADFYYHYIVNNSGTKQKTLDPYAKSMSGFDIEEDDLGKGAVVDLDSTNPKKWQEDDYIELEDDCNIVIYEMSVRDFTISPSSEVAKEKRGTYLGFIEKIPYLKELGITHVQLMPVLNFYFINEYQKEFEDIRKIKEEGKVNYNWGYDPHNYFTPEGWYSSDPGDPKVRIKELKQLIQALHDAGIGVILDVVYNHTAVTEIFEPIVPAYYYRRHADNSLTNGSGCGNDTASEREMMRKLIIDSTTYWTDEYHVDGFRFDLMGLHDEETIKKMADQVRDINPNTVLLGEGWNLGTLPAEEKYVKAAGEKRSLLRVESGPAVFNDGIRDALKQNHFGGNLEDGGFIQGFVNSKSLIRAGIIAGMVNYDSNVDIELDPYHRFADEPEEVINYVTCHDGYTLWDKVVGSTPNADKEQRIKMAKLGASIILTSQGRAFIHGGEEMLRTKPNPNKYKELDHNSYSSGDYTNQIDWQRKEKYSEVVEYYKGLIELRKTHPALRLETMEEIQYGLNFIAEGIDFVIAFKLDCPKDDWEEIIVVHNANRKEKTIKVESVTEDWEVVVDGSKAGTDKLASSDTIIASGEITAPPISTVVVHK